MQLFTTALTATGTTEKASIAKNPHKIYKHKGRIFIKFAILGPEKRHIPHKVVDSGNGVFRIEFTTVEVGSYVIDVTVSGLSVPNSPLIAKAYDASLIKVTDIGDGVVADLSTFRGN